MCILDVHIGHRVVGVVWSQNERKSIYGDEMFELTKPILPEAYLFFFLVGTLAFFVGLSIIISIVDFFRE